MLRDKFAMAAMQAMMPSRISEDWKGSGLAKMAYAQADAMMKERANWDFSGDPGSVTVVNNANHIHHGVDAPGKPTGVPGEWQPDWSQAPDGYDWWVAWADKNGICLGGYFYNVEPESMPMKYNSGSCWVSRNGESVKSALFGYQGDWRESLRKRPAKQPVPPDVPAPPIGETYRG